MKPSNKENLDGLGIDKNVAPGRLRDLFQRFMPSSRFREIFCSGPFHHRKISHSAREMRLFTIL